VALKKPSRRVIVTLSFVGALAFLYLILGGPVGAVRSYRLYSEVKQLEREVAETQSVIDSLIIEIDRLKNDTLYIERAARQKLGMARKDETIYKFVEEK
jgi:cell division protein FtsB